MIINATAHFLPQITVMENLNFDLESTGEMHLKGAGSLSDKRILKISFLKSFCTRVYRNIYLNTGGHSNSNFDLIHVCRHSGRIWQVQVNVMNLQCPRIALRCD